MNQRLYGVIALAVLVAGAVTSGALGQSELSLILAGAAAGTLAPQLFRGRDAAAK